MIELLHADAPDALDDVRKRAGIIRDAKRYRKMRMHGTINGQKLCPRTYDKFVDKYKPRGKPCSTF